MATDDNEIGEGGQIGDLLIIGDLKIREDNLEGESVKVGGDTFVIDRAASLERQKELVPELLDAIQRGDESIYRKFRWNLVEAGAMDVVAQLDDAFQQRSVGELYLRKLEISLPAQSMAERDIIRTRAQQELGRLPFASFHTGDGRSLSIDEVDVICTADPGQSGFILKVGYNNGVDAVNVLADAQIAIDGRFPIVQAAKVQDVITIRLGPANGATPFISTIQIYMRDVDFSRLYPASQTPYNANVPQTPPYPGSSSSRGRYIQTSH